MKRKLLISIVVMISLISCTCRQPVKNVYRYYWGKKDGFSVWIVDGAVVRNKIYSSFLYGGNEQRYPFTPKGEIWIDHAISCEEFELTLMHELNERHLMAKFGWTYYQSHDSSLSLELIMRKDFAEKCRAHEKSLKKVPVTDYSNIKEIKNLPDSIHLENIYRLPLGERESISVWIVDGYTVRATIYPDFGFSGNDLSCHFIPKNEIWIDGQISCDETEFSIMNELALRKEMASGKNFSDAYLDAIDQTLKRRNEMEHTINVHPLLYLPDTLTRDAGIFNPVEK